MRTTRLHEPLVEARLVDLVYELLDAHADTAELARELGDDPRWALQQAYLRDLQRTARELLADVAKDAP